MGGNVTVKSEVGVGSKFIIALELEAQDQLDIYKNSDQGFQNFKDIYSQNIIQNFN